MSDQHKYEMTISRLTVDKLGVKLYDRVAAVIAELIANSYDADASDVTVRAPMDTMLANRSRKVLTDQGYEIVLEDDGCGMTSEEVNSFYLKVGTERRKDPRRGDTSNRYGRKVMGRKGVGKLAPFGVCQKIEVLTSGGDLKRGFGANGEAARGYVISHLLLDRAAILTDTDERYYPELGELDGTVRGTTGTTLKLTLFDHRRVPKLDDFERQLSQRFGLSTPNWRVTLVDATKTAEADDQRRVVGDFSVRTMSGTMLRLGSPGASDSKARAVIKENGDILEGVEAGFHHEGDFFTVNGWMGYSEKPYRDELMAGVRIYCRGKFAAQTRIFNMKAGFTGEHDVRSYLVGSINADWLDEGEDLIRTDRQDILWSHELGQAFEAWGQGLVKKIGSLTREPRRKKAWDLFREASNIEKRVSEAFPLGHQDRIRERTLEVAKLIAQATRTDELENPDRVESMVQLSLLFGPHMTLDDALKRAADGVDDSLGAVTSLLQVARIAELAAFGQIADDRVRVIRKVESLKDQNVREGSFQELIEGAPWLIDPQWSPISANQAMTTLKGAFERFYKARTGEDLVLQSFGEGNKRPDFVLADHDRCLQIIEIKKPGHGLEAKDMDRLNKYVDLLGAFLNDPGNVKFKNIFPTFHVTLVCDSISLSGVHRTAFKGLKNDGTLTHITWEVFLLRTRQMHESFLEEAARQRRDAAQG